MKVSVIAKFYRWLYLQRGFGYGNTGLCLDKDAKQRGCVVITIVRLPATGLGNSGKCLGLLMLEDDDPGVGSLA